MTKTKTKFNRFFSWLFLNLLRASIVILGYTIEAIMYLSQFILWCLFRVGKPLGINIKYFDEVEQEVEDMDFTPKFTKDDIQAMAKDTHPNLTIKEIEEQFGLSYRQARKVKEASKNPLAIKHYQWTA